MPLFIWRHSEDTAMKVNADGIFTRNGYVCEDRVYILYYGCTVYYK